MEQRIQVLFGTETGNAEYCAEVLAGAIGEVGLEAVHVDMEDFLPESLVDESLVFIITSTHGNGDPPPNAAELLEHLQGGAQALPDLRYGVCGLGDSAFPYFAQCGKDFDAALERLGAQRVVDRVDCDDDFDAEFAQFKESVLNYVRGLLTDASDSNTSEPVTCSLMSGPGAGVTSSC